MEYVFSRMVLSCLAAAAFLVACGTAPTAGKSSAVTLASTQPAPAAADCPGFKTGMMRVTQFRAAESSPLWIDARAMTATVDDLTYTITKNAPCDYTISDGVAAPARLLVWSTGVAMFRSGNADDVSLVLPEQRADVAGSYARVP